MGLVEVCVLTVFLGAAVAGLGPRVWSALSSGLASRSGATLPIHVSVTWSRVWWFVVLAGAGAFGLVVLRLWLKRRDRARQRQLAALAEGIAALMDKGW